MADDRRSGRDWAEDPHDHQTATVQPPQLTCTHVALRSEAVVRSEEERIQVMAWEAAGSNAMSGRGCSDSLRCAEAPGRRLRWVADGCWSAVLAHGGCVMSARDQMGRWRPAVTAVHCCEDQ